MELHRMLLKVALGVICLLAGQGCCLDFRLGAILEEGSSVPPELVTATVERIVNDNWMYFSAGSNRRMVVEVQVVPARQSVSAIQSICTWQNVSALLGVGGCGLLQCVRDLGHSMGVPTVVVPVGLCDIEPNSNFVVVGREPLSVQISAAVAAVVAEKVTDVAIVYDYEQDFQLVQDFLNRVTEKGVATHPFVVTPGNSTRVARALMLGRSRLIVVLAARSSVREILIAANATGASRVDFQWLLADSGAAPAELLAWLGRQKASPANVLLVRGAGRGLLLNGRVSCPDQLAAVFGPGCSADAVTPAQLLTADAVLALATALTALNASDAASVSVAACRGGTAAWPAGATAAERLRLGSAAGLLGNNITFDTTGHVAGDHLEFTSTSASQFGGLAKFVETGRFHTDSGRLEVTFSYKNTRLLFANKFLDFKGKILTVCSPAISPYTIYTNASNGLGGKVVQGYNADLLSVLESSLNFRSLVRQPAESSGIAGCVSEVARGAADLALLSGINAATYSNVEFSADVLPLSHTILAKRPAQGTALWNVFLPFTYDVWLLILGLFMAVSVILYLLAYFNPFSAWNLGLQFAIADEVWFKEYIWSLMGSFLQQGQDFFPFAISPRTILAFWWLFTVIIFGTYTGELAAQLTIRVRHLPVKSLAELATDQAYVVHVVRGSSIHNSILAAPTGALKELQSRLDLVDSEVACAETVMNTPHPYQVCIMDQNLNAYYANNFCHQAYTTKDYFNPSFNGLVFPKNAHYSVAFNKAISKAKTNGIANLIRLKYFPISNPECQVPETEMSTAAIDLEGIGGTCILTISLYVVGLLVLGIELCWTNVCKKQPLDFICF